MLLGNTKTRNMFKFLLIVMVLQCFVGNIYTLDCAADSKCATCDSQTGQCTRCWSSYALTGNVCIYDAGAVANCETYYTNNKDKCAICKPGFSNRWDDGECAVSYSVLYEGVVTSKTTIFSGNNCRTVKVIQYDTNLASTTVSCLVCANGFSALKKGGGSTCANDYTVATPSVNPAIGNCYYEYGTMSYCYQCKFGYALSANKKTCNIKDSLMVDNCAQNESDSKYCKVCENGSSMLNSSTCSQSYIFVGILSMILTVTIMLY